MASAILGSSVIGAAGSIAGAALGGSGQQQTQPIAGLGAIVDPANAFATFDALLDLGFVDPSILQQASPLARAISNSVRVESDPRKGGQLASVLNHAVRMAVETGSFDLNFLLAGPISQNFKTGENALEENINLVGRALGFLGTSLEELVAAEKSYKAQIEPLAARAGLTSSQILSGRDQARQGIAALPGALPDISAAGINDLRNAERVRIERDIDRLASRGSEDVLRQANFANFNPGRALGELETTRFNAKQDADLDALGRALTLISGQQSAASNQLGLLSGVLGQGRDAVNNFTSTRANQGSPGGAVSSSPGVSGLSQGLSAGGNALQNFAQFQTLLASERGPAADTSAFLRANNGGFASDPNPFRLP